MNIKILIIGLDGVPFALIYSLIEEGWMPDLKRLILNRASGLLQSTSSAVTELA